MRSTNTPSALDELKIGCLVTAIWAPIMIILVLVVVAIGSVFR